MPPVVMSPPELWLTHLHALITLGNVILLLCLLFIYAKNYEQIKSKFALGLIAFVILLLVQAVTLNPFIHLVWGFNASMHWACSSQCPSGLNLRR